MSAKEWFSVYENGIAHVMPIEDDVQHTESEDCICAPTSELIQRPNGDAWLYTHSSLDGRELTEPDRKMP